MVTAQQRLCRDWDLKEVTYLSSRDRLVRCPSLRFTAGVHPHEASSFTPATLDALRAALADPLCVAVGECGLDYDRMFSPRDRQLAALRAQVDLAVESQLPLFIHERDRDAAKGPPLGSFSDLLAVLQPLLDSGRLAPSAVCIHCFTGSEAHLAQYVALGFMIGVTGFVALRQRGAQLRQALSKGLVPLPQLMLETDAPFMTPDGLPASIGVAPRKNEPCALPAVARCVAECLGADPRDVAAQTTSNALRFFQMTRF